MYDFLRTDKVRLPSFSTTQTIVDGINLDETLKGYRTLAVRGREINSRNIQTHDKNSYINSTNPFLDGAILLGSNIPAKNILVDYQVSTKNYRDQTELYELLNYYINKPLVKLIFTDDLKYFYKGTLANMGEIETSLEHKGEMEFAIHDPYKYSNEIFIEKFAGSGEIKRSMLYPVALEWVEIKAKTNTDKLIIKNDSTGRRIIIDSNITSTDRIKIYFKEFLVEQNGKENISATMDITSDYEDFEINTGDVISTNIDADIELSYRERKL